MRYATCIKVKQGIKRAALFCGLTVSVFICAESSCFSSVTYASSARITEVMYDVPGTDTGREWIEIENTSTSSIDLGTWKLFEANTNHKISPVDLGIVPVGAFAVIADVPDKFRADNPGYSGLLFDSTFSLGNDGETLIIRDENGVDVDSVAYVPAWGATGDGNSLQKSSAGTWIASIPTPGSATTATVSTVPPNNSVSTTTPSNTDTSGQDSSSDSTSVSNSSQTDESPSTHISQEIANTLPDEPVLQMTSGRARLGFVDSPLPFEAKMKAVKNISSEVSFTSSIENIWTLGDGTSLSGKYIEHAYVFPGDYVVILNSRYAGASAVSRVNVKIVDPHMHISIVQGQYIDLLNQNDFEVNVGGYSVLSGKGKFSIPQDTIINPHSSLKIAFSSIKPTSSVIAGANIMLADPLGKIVDSMRLSGDSLVLIPNGLTVEGVRSRYQSYKNNP